MRHRLKCWPEYFSVVLSGAKTFEVRRDPDCRYQVGDVLELVEWDRHAGKETGRTVEKRIKYIVRGPFPEAGLPEGTAVLGLEDAGAWVCEACGGNGEVVRPLEVFGGGKWTDPCPDCAQEPT